MEKKVLNLSQEPKIVVYDSGIGGKSIFKKCKMFFENSVFFCDSKNFPYGDKSFERLSEIFIQNIKNLYLKESDILILACNTISCVYFDLFKSLNINCKVVSILDCVLENNRKIEDNVIICTKYTSNFLNKLNIKNIALNELADLIEKHDVKNIFKFLENLKINEKNIIYGCTHYPIINDVFQKVYSNKVFKNPENELILNVKKNLQLIKC